MALYDVIGKTYAQTRRSDPRITKKLLEVLSTSEVSTVADIGAGSGSYALALAEHGYRVLAIEPSETMRKQAIAHPTIEWIDGVAECLPLPNQAVDAAIIMLAFHHFQNYRQALREVHRIVGRGQIVLFTYDPAMISSFWLIKYFPSLINDVESTFLPIPQLLDEMQTVIGRMVELIERMVEKLFNRLGDHLPCK
ncbi:MAG: class I SAM-dependent methyltransferase [Leptolyngbya sp. IPPAS B-1204]|nr:class I SAM-dependent methyltransferase [Elainella sp. C42_A2020_010]RNJ65114.1 MAG: class I SAM-dependent methyltransferase [Leptolyngbya sp. IPPAS B-1204]